MTEAIAIITLAILVVAQLVERYYYSKNMTQRLSEAMKAVMSRNINEFIAATHAEPTTKQEFIQTDFVPMDEATDEEFDKYVEKQNA